MTPKGVTTHNLRTVAVDKNLILQLITEIFYNVIFFDSPEKLIMIKGTICL